MTTNTMTRENQVLVVDAEHTAAVLAYAAKHGRRWKAKLADDWATGQDVYFRDASGRQVGGMLRSLRNSPNYGVEWLDRFRLPKTA